MRIGKNTWKIVFKPQIENGKTLGLCCPNKKTIYLATKQSSVSLTSTFIHEVLHAIEFEQDVKVKHEHIYALEEGLCDLFAMNDWLTK